MSIRNFFARNRENEVTSEATTNSLKNADAVVCVNAENKKHIKKMTQKECWGFFDFATFF